MTWPPDPDTIYVHPDGRTQQIDGTICHHYLDADGELWTNARHLTYAPPTEDNDPMTDHVHTFTDHGPTSTGGTWERCPCGVIRATENGVTSDVQQPADPDYKSEQD